MDPWHELPPARNLRASREPLSAHAQGVPVVNPANRKDAQSDCGEEHDDQEKGPDRRVRGPHSRGGPYVGNRQRGSF